MRPLNKRGLRDCQRMPGELRARLEAPHRVLCSHAARALQTCQVIADAFALGPDVAVFDRRLYLADVRTLLEVLADTPEGVSHLMLIGHNPGLTDLHNHLCADYLDNLPTFGASVLDSSAPDWASLAPGDAELSGQILPKNL